MCPSWMNRGCKCPPAKKCQFIPQLNDLQLNESGKQLAQLGTVQKWLCQSSPRIEMTTRCNINNLLKKHISLEGRA